MTRVGSIPSWPPEKSLLLSFDLEGWGLFLHCSEAELSIFFGDPDLGRAGVSLAWKFFFFFFLFFSGLAKRFEVNYMYKKIRDHGERLTGKRGNRFFCLFEKAIKSNIFFFVL